MHVEQIALVLVGLLVLAYAVYRARKARKPDVKFPVNPNPPEPKGPASGKQP